MILAELVRWWEAQPGGLPPGYQPAFLTKKVVLDADGGFRALLPVGSDKRGTRTGLTYNPGVPRVKRTSAVKATLLADNSDYALGRVELGDDPKKVAAKHDAFVALAEECAAATDDPGALAVVAFLRSPAVEALRGDPELQPDDDLVFEVEGAFVTDSPAVKEFWASRQAPSEDAAEGYCLVTGTETAIAARHPYKIKGIPGGQAQGTDLISINNPSGESYGLKNALNSPVGTVAAEAICNGLNALLARDDHRLRVGDTAFVWWLKEAGGTFDFGAMVTSPKPEDVAALLKTARDGGEAPGVAAPDFFALALSNNVSRTVVREEFATTLAAVKAGLGRWFGRLEIASLDGKPPAPPGVFRLAASLYRDAGDIPKRVPVMLLRAALRGSAPPRELLDLAVRRNRAEGGPYSTFKGITSLSTPRLALTRAVLSDRYPGLTPMLNPDLDSQAYQCGRLLSVLESIQRLAIPGLNATLTDRHYSAAAATPANIFGVLLKDAASAHLPKLRKNRPGAYHALDSRLQDVLGRLESFPRTLDYEGQGLFSLGYYHQKAADIAAARASKEMRELAEAAKLSDAGPDEEKEERE